MDFMADIMKKVNEEREKQVRTDIELLQKKGLEKSQLRRFELIMKQLFVGYGLDPKVTDQNLENPVVLESLKAYTRNHIDGTSLNSDEIALFHKFVDAFRKDVNIVEECSKLLEENTKTNGKIYLYDNVKFVLDRLNDLNTTVKV